MNLTTTETPNSMPSQRVDGSARTWRGRRTRGKASGATRTGAGTHYRIVNVFGNDSGNEPAPDGPHLSLEVGRLAPGSYATVVLELPASQANDGRALARGFYAVLWPMHDASPRYESSPQYFGPYDSARSADEFIRSAAARD